MFVPPRPRSLPSVAALIRVALAGDGDLLSLLPAAAYRMRLGWLGFSRRSILIVNDPEWVRRIMADAEGIFPKNDLMTGALEPLIGDSIFVSSGATWRRQRQMIDPAFSHMRLTSAFPPMAAAVNAYVTHLDAVCDRGEPLSLDLAMSHLTADVITRTVFSTPLASQMARDVFDSFTEFERNAAHVELKRLILDAPFANIPQHANVLDACRRIRQHLGTLVDTHIGETGASYNDIAAAIIGAVDTGSGAPFTREELIDQLGVFFLAGHETTASVLTWVLYIVATVPEVQNRIRAEVQSVTGGGAIDFEHTKRLTYVRNVFRETLRLYPPITFMPRVALQETRIGKYRVKRGAMLMISPWTLHRHRDFWKNPDAFDPDRFSGEREKEIENGTYIPFGIGPRVCIGAAFATTEATLIIARLVSRYDFSVLDSGKIRPVARLTTRPAKQIMCRISRRDRDPSS